MNWLAELENPTVLVSLGSAMVALASAIVSSILSSRKDERDLFDLRIKYFDNFRKWADQVADNLTESIHLCDLDPSKIGGESYFDRRHRLRISLSTMVDKGRWFFPNIEIDDHGKDKDEGFKGYRHEVLDGLVKAYVCLGKIDYLNAKNNMNIRRELVVAKRHFVGCVQKILDPADQRIQFERITNRRYGMIDSAG
ncbi:hypothetical protein [Beijerinckia sp. L45]|uniref:hypothetical protein n=1 Tax=Beijerinckia sp. L45 TaxID=1641855 RepID=UPI00131E5B39|nr:hypothetical protein [Beijerinckia sp. L45]